MKGRGKRDTTCNIRRSISFSPLHFILYRGKSITFGTVYSLDWFYRLSLVLLYTVHCTLHVWNILQLSYCDTDKVLCYIQSKYIFSTRDSAKCSIKDLFISLFLYKVWYLQQCFLIRIHFALMRPNIWIKIRIQNSASCIFEKYSHFKILLHNINLGLKYHLWGYCMFTGRKRLSCCRRWRWTAGQWTRLTRASSPQSSSTRWPRSR